MPLLSITDLTNGTAADANIWNTRFAAIANILNGNLDADNYKDASITLAKMGSGVLAVDNVDNPYKFGAYLSASQGVSAATWTKANLNSEDFDTNSNFDNATNYRYVVPVTGYYFIQGQIALSTTGTTNTANAAGAIYKNGSAVINGTQIAGSGDIKTILRVNMSRLLYLTAGDYMELYGYFSESGRSFAGGSDKTFMSGFLVSKT